MAIFYVLQPLKPKPVGDNLRRIESAIRQAASPRVLRWRYSESAEFLALVIDETNQNAARQLGLAVLQIAWDAGLYDPGPAQIMTFPRADVEAEGAKRGLFPPMPAIPLPEAPLDVGRPPDDNPVPPDEGAADPIISANCGRLLEWLTAAGSGRWEIFARVAVELRAATDGPAARSLARRLTSLGHLEWSADGARWRIAPPVLVASADGLIWCGARTERMRNALPPGWSVAAGHQPHVAAPPRWVVTGPPSADPVAAFGTADGVPCCDRPRYAGDVPMRLATRLPSADELAEAACLRSPTLASQPNHQEQFVGREFVTAQAPIQVSIYGLNGAAGLYRLTYDGPPVQSFVVHFDPVRPHGRQALRGDWNTLRFLIPGRRWAQHVRAEGRDWLCLSADHRWPAPHERALVLCSGLLPRYDQYRRQFWFPDVPATVAERLAGLLHVTFTQTTAEDYAHV